MTHFIPKHFGPLFGKVIGIGKNSMKRYYFWIAAVFILFVSGWTAKSESQTRKEFEQPGEELVYNVKYGFVKLGTVVIQTGNVSQTGMLNAHMAFWTADIPFLNVKTNVTDQFDSRDLTLRTFEEHTQNGDQKLHKNSIYDPATKTLVYSDEKESNTIVHNVDPFDDALGVLLNIRAWSGAVGHTYLFHVHSKDGNKPVTVTFTNDFEDQDVPALDDKTIHARVIHGTMDFGNSAPLGANGDFTAYVSNDSAAVPVRIDMKIAVGSISLILDKIKGRDWAAK